MSPRALHLTTPLALLAAALLGGAAGAPAPRLVFDSETLYDQQSFPRQLAAAGGLVYLSIYDFVHGEEIWRTDGTPEGTFLLADLCPGPCDGHRSGDPRIDPPSMLEVGDRLVFRGGSERFSDHDPARGLWASDGSPGPPARIAKVDVYGLTPLGDRLVFGGVDATGRVRLWSTDGTRAGTRPIKNVSPSTLTAAGELAFFLEGGSRLWSTDGTRAGTRRLRDFDFPPIEALAAFGDRVLFVRARELWVSDGTAGGTVPIFSTDAADVALGLPAAGGRAFFELRLFAGGSELWSSDGTAAGTRFASGLGGGQLGFDATAAAAGGRLLFLVRNADFELELWASDGTPEGTFFLLALPGLDPFSSDNPLSLTAAGDRVFFSLAGDGAGAELWTSDGTPEGTARVEVFAPGGDVFSAPLERPQDLIAAGRDVFFTRRSAAGTDQIWRSDGTPGGTVVVFEQEADDNTPLFELWGYFAGRLYYEADDGEHGREPWASDGTPEGSHLLADVGGPASGLFPEDLTPAGRLLFFRGSDLEDDWLWATDGTADGTRRVFPEELRRPDVLVAAGDAAFLMSTYSGALWRTDGTEAGTVRLVDDFRPTLETAVLDGVLYLLTRDAPTTLWRSDGSAAGTFRVAEISTGFGGALGEGLVTAGDRLVFSAPDAFRQGIWTSDGTFDGTVFIELPFEPNRLLQAKSKVYLRSDTSLWETDGTEAGTRRLLTYGEDLPAVLDVGVGSSRLCLVTAGPGQRFTLWTSDGTPGNAVRIATLPSRPLASFHERGFVAVGNAVFFAVAQPGTGVELWRANGARARRVVDLCPGPCSSLPQHPRAIDGLLYFAASDGLTGLEPWASDGTARGTFRLGDVAAGPASSDPSGFVRFGDEVYFRATEPASGTELWAFRGLSR